MRRTSRDRAGARSTRWHGTSSKRPATASASATAWATASVWRYTRPPRSRARAGEQPLRAGNVVTVEPGVYLPGRFGVRIEDLAVVEEGGAQTLGALPKALTVVA